LTKFLLYNQSIVTLENKVHLIEVAMAPANTSCEYASSSYKEARFTDGLMLTIKDIVWRDKQM